MIDWNEMYERWVDCKHDYLCADFNAHCHVHSLKITLLI
jgi:hypothetical protein